MRRLAWFLLAFVVILGVGGVVAWRDAEAAQDALADARQALRSGERSLADDHAPERARTSFRQAEDAAARARTRLDGPVWPVVSLLPRVGDSPALARAATDLAGAVATLGMAVTDEAGELLDGSALEGVMADGGVNLDRLADLASIVENLPTGDVTRARDRVAQVDPTRILPDLRDDQRDAVAQANVLITRINRAADGLAAARTFLGDDGPRTYLVAAQNPAELRGTGGLIGFMSELTVDDGTIALGEGVSIDVEESLTQRTQVESPSDLPDPVARSDEFAARYDHNAGGQFFGSVNLDPDLPTVAPVLLDLYAQEFGSQLDGVLMIDPVGLGMLVAATGGPLDLPAGLDTAGLPRRLPGNRIAVVVMVDGYDAFEGGGQDKKALDQAIVGAAFGRLTAGGWDAVEVGQALGNAFGTRHLQLFSRDEEAQATFERLGLAGQMATPETGDVLAVTGNNAAPNKADVHVAHRISGQLELGARATPGTVMRRSDLTVTVDNPLEPGDHHVYVTGSHEPVPIGSGMPPKEDDALNRTWFTVWTPPLTQLQSLQDGIHGRPIRYSNIHGHRAFDYFLETPSASTNSFSLELEGEVALRRDGDAWLYELTMWRQAKAIPDHWDLTITAPSGWAVAEATVDGGGAPTGMGAGGQDGERLTALVENGEVRVTGAVTRDATVTVRLTRP